MSFHRFVYYAAVIGGWAGLLALLAAEGLVLHGDLTLLQAVLTVALVGAALGAGLNVVSGMTNAQWRRLAGRAGWGLVSGAAGGAAGGFLGAYLFARVEGFPRFLGWMLMGVGLGLGAALAEGFSDRSARKLRNGLIGGTLGGLLGGLLFDPLAGSWTSMSGRAAGFVILGCLLGLMTGLAQVVLKEAWITVVDGFRPGRQLILSADRTLLGRGDHLPLPLLGFAGRDLESEHARVTRRPDGQFVLEDNGSRIGTLHNGRRLDGPAVLQDGDLIKLGANILRFNQRHRGAAGERAPAGDQVVAATSGTIAAPPPPPGFAAPSAPAAPPPPAAGPRPISQQPAPGGAVPWRSPSSSPGTGGVQPPPLPSRPQGPAPRIPTPPPPPR